MKSLSSLPRLLNPGDLLVFNNTRVIKARLFGEKPTGGAVEALVERELPGFEVMAHLRASKSPRSGSRISFARGAFEAEVLGRSGPDGGLFHLRFPADPLALLEDFGHVPLPPYVPLSPYISHADAADDVARYQTVFAILRNLRSRSWGRAGLGTRGASAVFLNRWPVTCARATSPERPIGLGFSRRRELVFTAAVTSTRFEPNAGPE